MPKTILVVEDEESMQIALTEALESAGFDVLTANNGKLGLTMALSMKPDLLILDIIMPEMDGIELMEKLSEDKVGKKLPIIFLTNLGDESNIIKKLAKNHNADYYIKSELELVDLLKLVKAKLKK